MRILLVEDHPDSREFLTRLLRLRGHNVDAVDCCADAMRFYLIHEYDLLLLDNALPDGNGADLLSELHQVRHAKSIAVTGSALPHEIAPLHSAGFDEVVIKPFTAESLFAIIERII